MSYYPESQKKYRRNLPQFALKFYKGDIIEGERLKLYLQQNNMSFKDYISPLIKADLDVKGIPYPELSDNIE